jgi:rhamnopyranosyl-N-acetylglucosaminyl-diphospho-decaprenol beta-1,3/1,4-galactofuranosyltransferase
VSENKHETVAAVVVTYNRKELLRQCLGGILAQTRPVDAIYVVDNASTDGTDQMIAAEYADRVVYERLPENIGGAGGFHHGMKRAYEDGYDWIWVMDDDAQPEPGCLSELLSPQVPASVEVRVPVRVDDNGSSLLPGSSFDLRNPFRRSFRRPASQLPPVTNNPEVHLYIPVEDFTFEGTIFRRSIVRQVGFPHKDLFLWCDDTEYALRIARCTGAKFLCCPSARIRHSAPSTGPLSVHQRQYYAWRNSFWIYRHYGENMLVRLKPIILFAGLFLKRITRGTFTDLPVLIAAFRDSMHLAGPPI